MGAYKLGGLVLQLFEVDEGCDGSAVSCPEALELRSRAPIARHP